MDSFGRRSFPSGGDVLEYLEVVVILIRISMFDLSSLSGQNSPKHAKKQCSHELI